MSVTSRILAIERCIDTMCNRFRGDNAFNYYTERDIQCELFALLRNEDNLKLVKEDTVTELVHAESPVVWKKGGVSQKWRDLVVWEPKKAKDARIYWGDGSKELAVATPAQVAIEIRHFHGGRPSNLKALSTVNQIKADDDIQKLLRGKIEYGYFLGFLDDDLEDEDRPARAKRIRVLFRKMGSSFEKVVREKDNRFRVCIVSRDDYRIRLGFSSRLGGLKGVPKD